MFKYVFILLFFITFQISSLTANEKVLKVAVNKDMAPYSYLDNDKKVKGFFVDYFKLFLDEKLYKIEFISTTAENISKEDVDIYLGVQKTKELEKQINFISPIYPSQQKIYINSKNKNIIKSINDLKGKVLGFEKNLNIKESLLDKNKDITLKSFPDYKQMYQALLDEKIDAFVYDNVLVWFDLVKDFDFSRVQVLNDFTFNDWFYIGINKEKKSLKDISLVVSNITKRDKVELENRWIVNKNLFYFDKLEKTPFTAQEIAYIKNKKRIRVGVDDWTPIYFISKNGKIGGVSGDFLEKISQISGLEIVTVPDNWANNLQKIKDKKIDLLPGAFYVKEREEFGIYSDPYVTLRNSIFYKQNSDLSISSFKDLEGKKLAVVKDGFLAQNVKIKFPKINLVEVSNTRACLEAIILDKADALLASDLVLYDMMKKELIVGINSVLQNELPANKTHFLSRVDEPLLHSILQKSLDSIANTQKVEILSKWLTPTKIKKELTVAFSSGKEPYIIDKKYLKGIEYDLIEKILNKNRISIKQQINLPSSSLENILDKKPEIDMIVGVQENKSKNLFYSDVFLNFENVAISRKKDNIKISSINDLKGKKIIAFQKASSYLGNKYNELFAPETRNDKYSEYDDQEQQVKDFLDGIVDVIILDKNIFRWYLNKFKKDSLHSFKFDYIFDGLTSTKVAFKDENLRNVFNRNLRELKKSGDYENIFNDYFQGIIIEKVKIKSLISSIVARNIFTDEIDELDEIVKNLANLPYIKKIEVFNNDDKLLSSSSNVNLDMYDLQDSYHFILNVPQKVGHIKIYFKFDQSVKENGETFYIPSLKTFENLQSYPYIKEVYKKFNYIDSKVRFTIEEQAFIKDNPVLKFSEINWKPLSIIEEDNSYNGLMKDYLNIIQDVSGLKFEFTPSTSFAKVISDFKAEKLPFTPIIGGYEIRREFGVLSDSYMTFSYAVVSNKKATFINDLNALNFKKIALPKFHTSNLYIKKNYPNIEIVETNSIEEALSLVAKGEVFATIEAMPVSIFYIKNYYPNLKIIGLSEDKFTLNFLVQKNKPELLSIINKVLASITYEQREQIQDKWVKVKVDTAMDYSILYKAIGLFLVVLVIFSFFYTKLSKAKYLLTLKTKDLKEQKEIFETLFNDTTDSLALLKDSKFIDCNAASLKLLGYNTKSDFLNVYPHEISPEIQPDGISSSLKEKVKIDECLRNGSSRFEWVHKKMTGENIWVDVLLTKISIHGENVLHVVWRDITDKKNLEQQVTKRNEELEDSNHELEMSIQNLKKTQEQLVTSEKMASLGGLVAGVAHEVNTPVGIGLTGITHLIELSKKLKKKYNSEKMSQVDFEEYLKTVEELSVLINSNLERAAELVKSFKKVAVDQTSEVKRKFNLKEYIEEILSSIYNITKKTKVKIDIISKQQIKINSYPGAISQIITNLIMNSLIHGYHKDDIGLINIELIKDNNKIKIIYKDDGTGIAKENLTRIFDPFFTTNRENGGSGLGLNIIYNIVTNTLGGTISCSSELNEGVEFIITFESS